MDSEIIKSLLSLLIWGGLIFIMVRLCCGVHGAGGHGHDGGNGKSDGASEGDSKDPVCGMSVDPQQSTNVSVYRGKTYHFCSASCRDKFEQTPEKYIGASPQTRQQQGAHPHG